MISRITRLIILCVLVGLCIYFVSINSSVIRVAISDHNSVEASSGVVVLFAFAFGLLAATIAAGFFAIKGYFREQGYKRREKLRAAQEDALLEVRSLIAAGELKRARLALEKMIGRDNKNALLRLELASVHDAAGDSAAALKVLDEARVSFPENDELILRTAALHERLGNNTAAIDAYALSISKKPTPFAVRKARGLSLKINRFEDALLYNDRLREMEGNSPSIREMHAEVTAHIMIRDLVHKPEELTKALITHLGSYEKCVVALKELSQLMLAEGKADEAAKCLQRAFWAERNPELIREARNIWFAHGYRDKSVSSIKTWVRDASESELLTARLELAKTFMLVSQDSDASYEIELLEREPFAQSYEAKREIAIIKAIIAYRSRDTLRSIDAFRVVEAIELEASPKTPSLIHDKI